MRKSLLLLFWFTSFAASAQMLTISATVVDKENGEALAFATISLKNKSIGTISNLQGEFDFHFSSDYANDTLFISILGYTTYEAPVGTLVNREGLTIPLTRSTTMLDEVVVVDSLRADEIMSLALTRITNNFADQPYVMDGFYRDIKKVGGTYISLLEAAAKIYDEDYKAPRNRFKLRESVALVEVRRSLGYSNKFTAYFDENNLLENLLLHNSVKYRQFPDEESFLHLLSRSPDSYYDGHDIFVLTASSDFHLKIFIDKMNYGIIHLEYEDTPTQILKKRKGMVSRLEADEEN